MSFTPGPWEADKVAVRASGPDGRQICLCEITVRGRPYDETYDEAIDNARLISAAREMHANHVDGIEILQAILEEREALLCERDDVLRDLLSRMKSALSKAEGHIGQELAPDPERRVNGNANGDEG